MIEIEKFRKNNQVYEDVRRIAHEKFSRVVADMPQSNKSELELMQGRMLSACDFVASTASLFCAYDAMMDGTPDIAGLYRALGDLTFGFDTNQFYGTFKGYLHPLLVTSVNAWLDSVEHASTLERSDNTHTRNLEVAGRLSWLNIISGAAFCLGGYGFARSVSAEMREQIIRVL